MKTVILGMALAVVALPLGLRAAQAVDPAGEGANGSLKGEYVDVDLQTKTRVFYWYGSNRDSGVNLELRREGKTIWKGRVASLGVPHSMYIHVVDVQVRDGKVLVRSAGSEVIDEVLDLATGKQLSRKVSGYR